MENGQGIDLPKKGRPNKWVGWTIFGKLINGQGAVRAGKAAKFSEITKQACPFIK